MPVRRRRFLSLAAAALAAPTVLGRRNVARAAPRRFEAVLFDGFPVIDPRPVAKRAEDLFPGSGGALMDGWRSRQFEYTWLRTLSGSYVDFGRVTEDALVFAARQQKLDLTPEKKAALLHAFLELGAWPDAAAALGALRGAGLRLAFLSNMTAPMLDAAVSNAGLRGTFEPHLSTDRVQAYKPDPRAYRMGLDAFKVERERLLFVASAGWDAAGARQFGYPTFWVNRGGLPSEELGVVADATGSGMPALVEFALRS